MSIGMTGPKGYHGPKGPPGKVTLGLDIFEGCSVGEPIRFDSVRNNLDLSKSVAPMLESVYIMGIGAIHRGKCRINPQNPDINKVYFACLGDPYGTDSYQILFLTDGEIWRLVKPNWGVGPLLMREEILLSVADQKLIMDEIESEINQE